MVMSLRIENIKDFDKNLIIDDRTKVVAKKNK